MANENNLWNENFNPEANGEKYNALLIEQYKLYVESAEKVSDRRNLANTFFLSIHTFLLGILGFYFEKGPVLQAKGLVFVFLVALLGICATWWFIVRSYRQLNAGKYQVIGELERKLPSSPWWNAEWKILKEGKNWKIYLPLTHLENWVPVFFAAIYITLAMILYLS
jgi:hypothetical protein